MMHMNRDLIIFSLALPVTIYLFNCLVARGWRKLELKTLLLYVSSVAVMGVFGEVFVGSMYNALFHRHLWDYTVFPIHHGYTSLYAPFIWGMYGFYLYMSHDTLRKHGLKKESHLALWFAVETVFLEAATNGSYRLFHGEPLFYYTPTDMWHLTSIQAIPFYLVAGFAIVRLVDRYMRALRFNIVMNMYFMAVFVYLVH